ncbi:hypothetical protein CSPX01_04808 [Colletotrichum filicis]|nr:hypothetical protein CSPX01_04808 [Colletotrichum filicis]
MRRRRALVGEGEGESFPGDMGGTKSHVRMTDARALVKVLQLSDGTRIEAQRTRTRFLKRGGWRLIRGDGKRFVACLTLLLVV